MTAVLILGTNVQLAHNTTPAFLKRDDVRLTSLLRRANRCATPIRRAFASWKATRRIAKARVIVAAMQATGLERLVLIISRRICRATTERATSARPGHQRE